MKKYIITLLFIFSMSSIWAQISGVVTDENDFPLEGAIVENQSTLESVMTNYDGYYEINANQGDVLNFISPTGLVETRTVNEEKEINVQISSTIVLKEVVAVGYGIQEKELVSSAVSSVGSEEIMENNPVRIDQALQGKASGVQVSSNSGSPGSGYNIRIRGVTTNGDNSPLVIVDGVNIGTDLSIIDPNDIEKIDVIKDASTAIYGVQGANGVILITTKSGKFNRKTSFNYNAFYSVQETSKMLDLMNAREYGLYTNETMLANGNEAPYPNFQNLGNGSNWQAELFQLAPMFSHNLSANGGGETVSYGFSGNFTSQDGIIAPEKSNYQRWTLRNNLGVKLTDKLQLNTLINYTNTQRQAFSESGRGGALYYAYNASPVESIYDGSNSNSISGGYNYLPNQGIELINPLALIDNTFNQTKVNRFTGKVELEYEIIKNLKATSRYNFNYSTVKNRAFYPLAYYGPGKVQNNVQLKNNEFNLDLNDNGIRDVYSTVSENQQTYFDYTWETFLNYNFSILDSHNFQTLLGTSFRTEKFDGNWMSGYLTNGAETWANAYISNTISFVNDPDFESQRNLNPSSSRNTDKWFSVFGRVQYDYLKKYLFSAMVRRDASTRFGPNNRAGYFPSFTAGWVLSKEDFLDSETLSYFKLRGSWGITGNDKIGSYRWIGLLQGANADATYPFGDILVQGNAIGALSNPDLLWEKNFQTNIGFEATLWNKLDITLDYYTKKTENLLLVPEVSALLGASAPGSSAPFVNAGSVQNNGVDLSLNLKHEFSEDFGMNISYNLTTIKNEVLDVNNQTGFLPGGLFSLNQSTSRMQTGLPLGAFYGLKADGIFQNQEEIDRHAVQAGAQPGDIRYVDIDGDGNIEFGSEDDLTQLGKPIPDMLMGLNLGSNYKGFDASISLYASIGSEIVRSYERFLPYSNRLDYYLQRWRGEGTSNEVPRASTNAANNYLFSSFYVEDGSYLRIQNIQIGYTFPTEWLENAGIERFRLYFGVNNLYTFTNYLGYDPDISNANPIAAGVDLGQYPQTRSFITGINLTF